MANLRLCSRPTSLRRSSFTQQLLRMLSLLLLAAVHFAFAAPTTATDPGDSGSGTLTTAVSSTGASSTVAGATLPITSATFGSGYYCRFSNGRTYKVGVTYEVNLQYKCATHHRCRTMLLWCTSNHHYSYWYVQRVSSSARHAA